LQTVVAVGFGAGVPIWRLGGAGQPLLPEGYFASLGLLVVSAGVLFGLSSNPAARTGRGAGIVLAILSVLLPLADLELCLRPFVELGSKQTNLFVSDPELGWRLRPGANAEWGNVRVKINANGLRGPPVPYERDESSLRILYLGDSVTFGYMLPKHEQSFPFQAERMLEQHFGVDVETINASVGGYSPWQELAYLRREGFRYSPDLIVIGFVLNDVTEKMDLLAFGGRGVGFQLYSSYQGRLDWLRRHSALVHSARALLARLRFGPDVVAGAMHYETWYIEELMLDDPSARIDEAWRITLENLDGIFDFCHERDIPVALVVFPDLLQFRNFEKLNQPQRMLVAHAESQGVPVLDLLRPMAQVAWNRRIRPHRFFIDHNHLTPSGSRVAARLLRDFLARHCRDLLPDHCPS
jgi:lysophospholipase L1-like esterase